VTSDLDRYYDLRRKMREPTAEKWYELGRWARSRGTFYDDRELLAQSEQAFRKGFELERKAVAKNDPEALLQLAAKARKMQLGTNLSEELAHEAFHQMAVSSADQLAADLKALAARMSEVLADCRKRLRIPPDEQLVKNYKARPLETYSSANYSTRRILHRLLYSEVILRTITPDLAADGSNGFEVAAQI